MNDESEKGIDRGYEDLIQEGLKVVDEHEERKFFLGKQFELGPSLERRFLFPLCFLAFLSITIFLFQNFGQSSDGLQRENANLLVFQDIQRTPRSPRAKTAAQAVVSFTFSIDLLARQGSSSAQSIDESLDTLRKKLRSTEEDSALIQLFEHKELTTGGSLTVTTAAP